MATTPITPSNPAPEPVDIGGGTTAPSFVLGPAQVPAAGTSNPATSALTAPTVATPDEIIAAIDTAIAEGGDVAAYTVNGRTVQLRSLTEMLRVRQYYAAERARIRGLRRTRVKFR